MTAEQTGAVMDALKIAYPRYYAELTGKRRETALTMWASAFAEDDVRVVLAAVQSFIAMDEKGFPPVPGQIKAKIRLIAQRGEATEAEAWAVVSRAVENAGYPERAEAEFQKLPAHIQRILGGRERGIAQLREWSQMRADTLHSVVASNFQRSYREFVAREREYRALPPDVQRMISGNGAGNPALEGGASNGK